SPPPGVRANVLSGSTVPTVGQAITINSGVQPGQANISCTTNRQISGTVRTVGDNFVIVEDDAVAGALTTQDYAELDAELDQFIAPVDQVYFGTPADLDGNERVIAFFTKEVNLLTDPGSPILILGFFWPGDIADPADCGHSNEAEIMWLRAPDPNGDFGAVTTVSAVKRIARSLVSHEYQHLLNAEQRTVLGGGDLGDFEHIWLNEGMSHIAEEVSGFFRVGVPTRGALDFDDVSAAGSERTAFDDFHSDNLRNVDSYLSSPTEVASLSVGNPDDSFPMRGYGYLFLRWLGDRFGAATPENLIGGSAEDELFREISSGGPSQMVGVDNILRAVSVVSGENLTWDELLAEYFAAPATIDAVAAPPSELRFSTWDFPALYDGMAAATVPDLTGGFPLRPLNVAMGTGASSTSNFEVGASTAKYFRFSASGSHPDMLVEFTATSGANVPNGARASVIVVRTR
ncbi:MAG: hypothetical protein OEU54_12735, partial [Gemmatimonadota bacterium]|nr:hypothetical protein [Gemmatimonadota bacterium]